MLSSKNEVFILLISLKETRITAILYQQFSSLQHVMDICLAIRQTAAKTMENLFSPAPLCLFLVNH